VSESQLSYSGFTLVELSIVIVIIGFIVAGIVGGQALVKQAQLRSTFAKMQAYKSATMSFKDIYNDLPGDFKEATSYWPGVTFNGDGDRRIEGWAIPEEDLCFFSHPSLSKVINENFSYPAFGYMVIGQTHPKTPFSNLTIYAINTSDIGGEGNVANKNVLVLAAQTTTFVAQGAAASAKDALATDSKFDDGIYNTGLIHSLTGLGSATQCINAGTYNLTTGGVISCRVQFLF
jgi:prepilin-type N-terminal cleavage/methylation domain-containing protein